MRRSFAQARKERAKVPFGKVSVLFMEYGANTVLLESILGCSRSTAQKKLDEPQRFTLEEIALISKGAHIPIEEIRAAISF